MGGRGWEGETNFVLKLNCIFEGSIFACFVGGGFSGLGRVIEPGILDPQVEVLGGNVGEAFSYRLRRCRLKQSWEDG